jgi:hypothetical protein
LKNTPGNDAPQARCQPRFDQEKSMTTAIESRIPRILEPAPPVTVEDAHKRTNGGRAGLAVETWYLAKKDLADQAK